MDIEKECRNLQNILKSAANGSLGTMKGRNRKKYLKIWNDQIKQLIETKKKLYKNGWIQRHQKTNWNTKETALAKREVGRRQRLSWDKFVRRGNIKEQPNVYKILKQISKDVKETAHIEGNRQKCIPSLPWKFMEYNKHKWITIRTKFNRLLTGFFKCRWTRKGVKINKNGKSQERIT